MSLLFSLLCVERAAHTKDNEVECKVMMIEDKWWSSISSTNEDILIYGVDYVNHSYEEKSVIYQENSDLINLNGLMHEEVFSFLG